MGRRFAVEKVRRKVRDAVHGVIRAQSENRKHQGGQAEGQGSRAGEIALHAVKLRLAYGVLFHEDCDEKLGHIGQGQAAGEEEDPLHRRHPAGAKEVRALHDALVQEGLAHIAVEQGNAADAQAAKQKGRRQQGLFAAEAADLVEIELMQVPEHRAGAEEEDQLEGRVVDHVQYGPAGGQGVFLAQQTHHANAHQDEADLGHGRAGEGPLEVDGKQGQHRSQEHGHRAEDKDHGPPGRVAAK